MICKEIWLDLEVDHLQDEARALEADREGVGTRSKLGDNWDGPNKRQRLFNFYIVVYDL
jgi:hypothetical protein